MLTGTSVPYDPAAENVAQCQDHDRANALNGTASSTTATGGVASAAASSGASSSTTLLKNVPIRAIVFSDQSSIANDTTTSHLRPATPSSLRPDGALERRGFAEEGEEECSLPSPPPPPPPSIQTLPVMQMQALHLHHQPAPQYPSDPMGTTHNPSSSSTGRSCFSPPPPAIVTTALMSSTGTHAMSGGAGSSSGRQLPPYPPAVPLPKPTPIWITPGQHSSGSTGGNALGRDRSVSAAYSTASTITVATGSNSPAVVSTVPILRTFGASAGSRQNSFGS
ncbi:uncharacterized protein Rv2082-like [Anopheles stephensi]|uniref:uncharacterized protein Rv2082-like n=1 Tax=Anopheles stephensi TaxID=30069 RepID=UPI001658A90C|nr:uncharacterized protein Rv2082-like [Anopheles stephensi]XP_035918444.1 uncharacterized protein Rv2082-like [Anopheles stephensi]